MPEQKQHPGTEKLLRDDFSPPVLWDNPELDQGLSEVRRVLTESAGHSSPLIYDSLKHLIEGGGKLLRPALVLLSGWYGGKNADQLTRLAASVEMMHMATLVHDDILDDSPFRRGNPALHVTMGIKTALLMGDYLFARSFSLLEEIIDNAPGIKTAKAIERICEGEIDQNHQRYSLDSSLRGYLRRIGSKTAALITASLYLGASHGGCNEMDIQRFRRFGYNLGMAFQIVDDLLDFEGSQAATGKPVARDMENGIFTAPVIFTLESSSGEELRAILSSPPYSDSALKAANRLVHQRGGIDKTRRLAARYSQRAADEASGLEEGLTRKLLSDLTGKLLVRTA